MGTMDKTFWVPQKVISKVISSRSEPNTHLDSYEAYWGILCGVHVIQHKMSTEWDTPKQEEEVHSMIHKLSGVSVWSTYETILLCLEVPQGQKGLEMNYKSIKKFCVIQTKTAFIAYICLLLKYELLTCPWSTLGWNQSKNVLKS